MPELPEVETVRRTLAPAIGQRVGVVWASRARLRGALIPRRKLSAAVGQKIEAVRRWGKYLMVDIGADGLVLVVHLGMTGRLRLHQTGEPRVAHTHMVLELENLELRYSDPRRFGHVSVTARAVEHVHTPLSVLGLDALSAELSGTMLHRHTRRSRQSLKSFLMDQSIIAGLGNIYVCEALWVAKLRPTTRSHRLSLARANALVSAIRRVLNRALELGGTSLRDFVAADGATGENVHYLRVYGREGERCQRRGCGGVIRRRVVGGRATFHCPRCQTG